MFLKKKFNENVEFSKTVLYCQSTFTLGSTPIESYEFCHMLCNMIDYSGKKRNMSDYLVRLYKIATTNVKM